MIVKIGSKLYDGLTEPIMVILTEEDKKNIGNMHRDATKYCEYPDLMSSREANQFMDVDSGTCRCAYHPGYRVKRRPTGNCNICYFIWTNKVNKQVQKELKKKIKR
jgi:hypothetical protein